MATPEKKVRQKIRSILDSYGAYRFAPMSHGYAAGGTHDEIACYKGRFISIEAKADATKKPTALQTRAARQVVAAGGIVLLIHDENTQLLEQVLESIRSGYPPLSVWPGLWRPAGDN